MANWDHEDLKQPHNKKDDTPMPSEPTKTDLCPGCEEVTFTSSGRDYLEDAGGRPWHRICAGRKLADHFRSPLTKIAATAAVTFELEMSRGGHYVQFFTAPHSFHLREIELPEGAQVTQVFIGQKSQLVAWDGSALHADEISDRKIVIDHDVPMGLAICIGGTTKDNRPAVARLFGERRPEKSKPRRSSRGGVTAVVGISLNFAEDFGHFVMPAAFTGTSIATEDWEGWSVVKVFVGVDPGRAIDCDEPLTGRVTKVPIFTSKLGEVVTVFLKNRQGPRKFTGRIYGTVTW